GGLFEVHQLEEKYEETIQIPDAAFETVFNFFDEYDWHLDDRPLRNQNEINPDVLGYIFEKYINQKQMGAYYTKEDITEHISKNTIIPFLFDAAQKACKIAFKPDGALWALLRENGDRYIYEAVRQGVDLELPAEIAVGIEDVSQRGGWNKPAAAGFALPTETWREHVARRQRCLELRQKLAVGEVTQINDLITYNLDIRQFAQDVITSCESSDLLKALYQAIEQVSVLDPTCGSGAFLFAALNILEPLYTACLERMQGFVDEDDLRLSREVDAKPRYEKFRTTLAEMAKHPNPRYFVLKSIMLNNLYGVDIMEEATEICKLRLFLKLVAQMEAQPRKDNFGLEPLPDIDFNIRAGNTLVGFASLDEVRKAIKQDGAQLKLDFQDDASRIDEKAELADRAFQRFRQMQTEFGMNAIDFRESKKELRRRLAELNDELNCYLAREYGVDADKPAVFEKWRDSHQPFHWFIEFYSIIDRGGFDVIIGNPPYIESSKVKSLYDIQGLTTVSCGNLYAICMERSLAIMKDSALLGFVVQRPFSSTQRMKLIRNLLLENSSMVLCSTYDDRPSKLFDGINHARIAISISQKSLKNKEPKVYVTPYEKWYKEERERLFQVLSYSESNQHVNLGCFPKISSFLESDIIEKIISCKNTFSSWISPTTTKDNIYYKITGVGHWFTITARPPKFLRQGQESSSTRESLISFSDKKSRGRALSVLNSSLFYWFYQVRTNCRDFNPSDYKTFPIPLSLDGEDLSELSEKLCKALDLSSAYINVNHSQTGAIQMEQFKPREAKPIIDEIDRVLAQHYGFTAEELDFIINYDIKYRMGRDNGGDD
ncbi:Eco57I restriction-modification methylase domain-containing protein, partial [Chamaesiphon sp.]|uniref:Eco57I restriction-modification methylase domain-containing protein n=1 Tax=Chamaesiphon sp. TaxID=2814140 RepID=UPI0035932687